MGFETFSPAELLERVGPLKIEIALPDAIQEDLENVPRAGEFYVPQTECFVTMTLGPNQAFTIAYDELGGAWRHRGEAVDLEALGFVNALVGVQRQ
jgi:hypothetical protein